MSTGNLFIISAPSGTGKSTILKEILATVPGVAFSISHTTRKPRTGERDGTDYHFVDKNAFLAMRDQGAFLEWAEVHGNYYGTSRQTVEQMLATGTDVLLDIDVQGARQVRNALGQDAVSIFIVPPSWDELQKRLVGRKTDDQETIALRLANARREMADEIHYDYVIVNGVLQEAVDILRAVLLARRSRNRRGPDGTALTLP